MPIVGLTTRDGTRRTVERVLGEPFVDGWERALLRLVLAERNVPEPSMSQIFGGAWRKTILEFHLPYYVTIDALWPRLRGTLFHLGYEQVSEGSINETRFYGQVNGIRVTGQIDRFYPIQGWLIDLKTTLRSYENLPLPEHFGQVTGYRWLLEENGFAVDRGSILYATMYRAWYVDVEWWDDGDLLETLATGAAILQEGFANGRVPSTAFCNKSLCPYCPVANFCLKDEGPLKVPPHRAWTAKELENA